MSISLGHVNAFTYQYNCNRFQQLRGQDRQRMYRTAFKVWAFSNTIVISTISMSGYHLGNT